MQRVMQSLALLIAATATLVLANATADARKPSGDSFHITISAWQNQFGDVTVWFDARGAIDDDGPVTTYLAYDDQGEPLGWVWVLEGRHGTIEVLDAGSDVVSARQWGKSCNGLRNYRRKSEGEFILFDGNGAYAGAAGAGTYVEEYQITYTHEDYGCVPTADQVTKLTGSLLP